MKILDHVLFVEGNDNFVFRDVADKLRLGVVTNGKGNNSPAFQDDLAIKSAKEREAEIVASAKRLFADMLANDR
ncbi:hypothetical protein [Ideonella paludis]|uniref:Uncharacterized protein n=1 Tax=Ideonella paludis TaxID=1233411 RepID=A0ABS5DZF0_9BURK|nr:hypothetical protein [Ideonella paludis]MBQ0936521.1 hypothetical protein [Ideonella paludis]